MGRIIVRILRVSAVAVAISWPPTTGSMAVLAQAPEPAKSVMRASQRRGHEGNEYLSSDELQGRQVFTGATAGCRYVADHLKEWGIKPLGDDKDLLPERETQGL